MNYVIYILLFVKISVMKGNYKCSDTRLVEYFETSRNKWKARSIKYQNEKRELINEIRDLRRSKEKWKNECRQHNDELRILKMKEKKRRKYYRNY